MSTQKEVSTLSTKQPAPDNISNISNDEHVENFLPVVKESCLKRCSGKTIVLLHGHTGAGKSSFINQIFTDINLKISSQSRGTDKTEEYVSTSGDFQLNLIDTPGFGDVDDTEQDIRNMVSIRRFFEEHPNYDRSSKFYPNLILIVCNASDNRIIGPETRFCQTLKMFKHLELVDMDHPNVLLVFTHACSIAGHTFTNSSDGNVMWSDFRQLYNYALKAFACYLKIVPSVVFVENHAQSYDLSCDGEWTILPCGTRQPINAFECMLKLLRKNGDKLAAATISHFFCIETKVIPVGGFSITPSEDDLCDAEELLYDEIFPECNNEHQLLSNDWGKSLSEEVAFLNELFVERGYHKAEEIKGKSVDAFADILYPYTIGSETLAVLRKSNLISDLPQNFLDQSLDDVQIGMGFDIYSNKVLNQSIYSADVTEKCYTCFGFSIPRGIILTKYDETIRYRPDSVFDLRQCVSDRLNELGVYCELNDDSYFDEDSFGTRNLKMFRQEQCLFTLTLNEYEANVTNAFKKALKKIPTDPNSNTKKMKKFFQKWGHYVVVEIYGGGVIEGGDVKDVDTISWHGGVIQKSNGFERMVEEWKDSLHHSPIAINNKMKLTPIWKVVENLAGIDKNYEKASNSIKIAQKNMSGMKEYRPLTKKDLLKVSPIGLDKMTAKTFFAMILQE